MEPDPYSSRPHNPWAAPDPSTRYGATWASEPVVEAAPASSPSPRRPHRTRTLVAATAAACFALGLSTAAVLVRATADDTAAPVTTLAPATTPAPSATTTPRRTPTTPATTDAPASGESPATTAPTTPSTRAPRPSTSATAPQQTSDQTDLKAGLVDIYTVLRYQGAEAAGTGIVLSADGRVLTNNHVINGSTEITVVIVATGKEYRAKVVGTNRSDDIALLQLEDASGLTPARLGDSSTVQVGDPVTGVGNAGGDGGEPTISRGQVTALGQTITATDESGANSETLHNLIEISAQLQPGQSGGPLYNAAGEVVGVDSAGSVNGRFRPRGNTSRGYAIPINDALANVALIESGKASDEITIGTPPLLGISATDAAFGETGVSVQQVVNGSPADQVGLQAGDTIVGIDEVTIASSDDLTSALRAHRAGDEVKVTWVDAAGTTRSGNATLIAGPAD